jgi:hypothetical protein
MRKIKKNFEHIKQTIIYSCFIVDVQITGGRAAGTKTLYDSTHTQFGEP